MVNQLTGKRRRKALNDIVPINTAASTAVFGDSTPEPRGMKLAAVRPRQKSTAGLRGIAAAKPNTAEAAQAAGIFHPRKGTAGLIHLSGADTENHSNGANSPNSVGINASAEMLSAIPIIQADPTRETKTAETAAAPAVLKIITRACLKHFTVTGLH